MSKKILNNNRQVFIGKEIYSLPDGTILKHTNKNNFIKIKYEDNNRYIIVVDANDNLLNFIKHNKILIHNDNTEYRFVNLHCKFYPDIQNDNNPLRKVLRLSNWGDKIHKFTRIELPCETKEELNNNNIKSFIFKRLLRNNAQKYFKYENLVIRIINSYFHNDNENWYSTIIWTITDDKNKIFRKGSAILIYGKNAKKHQLNIYNNKKQIIEKRLKFRNEAKQRRLQNNS